MAAIVEAAIVDAAAAAVVAAEVERIKQAMLRDVIEKLHRQFFAPPRLCTLLASQSVSIIHIPAHRCIAVWCEHAWRTAASQPVWCSRLDFGFHLESTGIEDTAKV